MKDGRRYEWLLTMVRGIAKTIGEKARGREGEEFSAFMVPVLMMCIEDAERPQGRFGGRELRLGQLCDELMIGRRVARRYLQAAARAGLIKGVVSYERGTNRCFPLEVIVNPALRETYGQTRLPDARTLGVGFGKMWLDRQDFPGEVQGFDGTVFPWGRAVAGAVGRVVVDGAPSLPREEPVADTRSALAAKIIEAAKDGSKKTAEAIEREENKKRRERAQSFVDGAAALWVHMQARRGHGDLPPTWAGDSSKLAPTARPERTELVRLFETYGGRLTSIAWACFNGSKPILDEKGKLKFEPSLAHKQWTTPDKRPHHFAKYFSLIMGECERIGWLVDEDLDNRLREFFGEVFDAPALRPVTVKRVAERKDNGYQAPATTPPGGGDDVAHDAALFGDSRGR